jgi:hypothetical protein
VGKASFLDDVLSQPRVRRACWVDELPSEAQKVMQEIVAAKAAGRIPNGYMASIHRKFCTTFNVNTNVHVFREWINVEARKQAKK